MTVYTEDDGTKIDEDTLSAFDPGSTFICIVGNKNWPPSTPQEENNTPGRPSSSIEEKTIQTSDTVTVAHTAKVGTLSFSLFFSSKDSTCSTPEYRGTVVSLSRTRIWVHLHYILNSCSPLQFTLLFSILFNKTFFPQVYDKV